jgi:Asp/Glu/hydantoin racemase
MKTLAIVHTTPVTVDSLKALAAELLPDYRVINFVDDSILPQLKENGGQVEAVAPRLIQYMKYAEEAGADIILSACSSVGEVVAQAQQTLRVPVVRIDEAMAEAAVQRGKRVGVAATLITTLRPTLDLIKAKAAEQPGDYQIESILVSEAFERLMAGDRPGHDALLAAALEAFARQVDVIVLAQASMAQVVDKLPEAIRGRFLSSPRLGMERVRDVAQVQSQRSAG